MHCQQCHKNFASIRYAEVVDGQVMDQHLCSECLEKRKFAQKPGFEFTKPAPFMRREKESMGRGTALFPMPVCPSCDRDINTIKNSGLVGCADCYVFFRNELTPLLVDMHGSAEHHGKVPKLDDARARVRQDLETKRALLKRSLRAERYEEAALLRDEIKAIEGGLISSDKGLD